MTRFSGFVHATAEICFAITLTLGFAVRPSGILDALLTSSPRARRIGSDLQCDQSLCYRGGSPGRRRIHK